MLNALMVLLSVIFGLVEQGRLFKELVIVEQSAAQAQRHIPTAQSSRRIFQQARHNFVTVELMSNEPGQIEHPTPDVRLMVIQVVAQLVARPVFAIISDAPVSTIATDNYHGGRLAGRRLGELLGGEGNVILLRVQVGSASCEAREQGFLDELAESFPGLKVISSNQHGGATRNTALGASQNLLTRFGREVHGIFTPNESTGAGMLVALSNAGLGGGKVKLVAFANSRDFVDAIRAGDLHGLVLQDPEKMGYLGVKSVVQVLRGEAVPKLVDTGVVVATAENLDDPEVVALVGK